jgi:tripartite-type tricarboxylate transporter receptor subunit TctC
MRSRMAYTLLASAVAASLHLACQLLPAGAPAANVPPAAAPAPAGPPPPDEPAVASFYRGKTVRFIVGFPAGGGFDTYTRAIARHIGKYIPGNPTVIVENMPGAGSLIAANYVYAATRPDGLTIGNWIGGLILQQVLGAQGIEFDARRYRFLGVPVPDNVVCAVRKESGFRSFSDAINSPQPLILGGSAPGSSTDDPPKVLAAAIGLNLKLVSGYGGTAPIRQAADAGEVHGGCWAWESIKVTWKAGLEAGDVLVIGQVTERKLPELPNVESALELARTEEARQLIRSGIIVPSRLTRPYAVHPDTPPERLAALRQAFMAVFKDPGFLEDAQKASLDIDPIPGEEVEQLVRELFDTPEHIKAQLRMLLLPS